MFRHSLSVTILALFCLHNALCASDTGVIAVTIASVNSLGEAATPQDQKQLEFEYDALEWGAEPLSWTNEWAVEEEDLGEFLLTDQAGDAILITASANEYGNHLSSTLNAAAANPVGGQSTVASNIANSIVATQSGNAATITPPAAPVIAEEAALVEATVPAQSIGTFLPQTVAPVPTTETVEAVQPQATVPVQTVESTEAVQTPTAVSAQAAQPENIVPVENVQAVPAVETQSAIPVAAPPQAVNTQPQQ